MRRGATLLELLVVLALVAVVSAIVGPSVVGRPPREVTLNDAVRAARSAAIARSQVLVLHVAADGRFSLRALPPADTLAVLEGQLRGDPVMRDTPALRLQLSPHGACVPLHPVPAQLQGWDAARCRSEARVRAGLRAGGDR